jgi:hypothetical protein
LASAQTLARIQSKVTILLIRRVKWTTCRADVVNAP